MKAVVAAFNQEKALVGAFSVITNLRMELFEALMVTPTRPRLQGEAGQEEAGRQLLPPAPRREAQAGEQALHGAAPGGAETGRGQAM